MHIPSHLLQGQVCPVTAAVSAIGVASVSVVAMKAKSKPNVTMFGAVAAFLFVAQMFNFPIQQGTSGHLLGGVLASALLGVPFGVLAISLVVTLQALLFSDGGLSVLGANVLNMALIGAGVGGFLRSRLGTAMAAWVSVMLAALACSIELSMSGNGAFTTVAGAMLSVHSLISLGEAVLTVLLVKALAPMVTSSGSNARVSWAVLGTALSCALLSPLASSRPDGLEWVAQKFSLFHENAPAFVAPFPDYTVPMLTQAYWSTAVSGVLGALAVFAAGVLVARSLAKGS